MKMTFQTLQKDKNNRDEKLNEGLKKALRSIWLRGLVSNQRPSAYTLPTIFIMEWTILSTCIG